MTGLLVDMAGVFFLSIEGLKTENLRVFRIKVLARIHYLINPPIMFVDKDGNENDNDTQEDASSGKYPDYYEGLEDFKPSRSKLLRIFQAIWWKLSIMFLFFIIVGLLIANMLNHMIINVFSFSASGAFLNIIRLYLAEPLMYKFVWAIPVLWVALFAFLIVYFLGFLPYWAIVSGLQASMRIIESSITSAPSGRTAVLGLGLVLFGFLLQFISLFLQSLGAYFKNS